MKRCQKIWAGPPPHLDKIQKNGSFCSGNLPLVLVVKVEPNIFASFMSLVMMMVMVMVAKKQQVTHSYPGCPRKWWFWGLCWQVASLPEWNGQRRQGNRARKCPTNGMHPAT